MVGTSVFEGACDGIKVAFPLKIDEGAAEEPEILGIKVLFDSVPFTLILGAELWRIEGTELGFSLGIVEGISEGMKEGIPDGMVDGLGLGSLLEAVEG